MPCMGPAPPTDAQVNDVFEEVLELLQTKHKMLMRPNEDMVKGLRENRAKVLEQLREAIAEVMWQENMETF